jgi:haloacetate dehalogenase
MWHRLAPALSQQFSVVMIDLRGYGDSSKPAGDDDHSTYSKRRMAADVIAVADHLGHQQFALCGHDRGGRVAHRLALDHPDRVEALCLLDIAPTLDMYEGTDMRFALAYYHWFFYVQPHPVPERLIGADPQWYLSTLLGGWGSADGFIDRRAMDEYVRCFTPEAIHAMCEDYRASVTIDLEHDRASRLAGDRIRCPVHVVWGRKGVVERCFDPLALWQAQAEQPVTGRSLDAGHFLAEELPEQIVAELLGFFDPVTSAAGG